MPVQAIAPERELLNADIGEELFQLVWRYRQQADQQFAPFGLNSLRALVLGLIAKERQHPKALANHLDLAPPAISHLLTEFEERGLVARSLDTVDRRRVALEITEAGKELLAKVESAWTQLNSAGMANLSDKEAGHFRDLLRKIAGTP